MEAYVARVGVGVAYCEEKKVFDPSFSAKLTSFYAGKIWLSHPNSATTLSVRAPDVSRTNRALMRCEPSAIGACNVRKDGTHDRNRNATHSHGSSSWGVAGADRDRAGVDIAVVDMPAFLAGVSRSAAGEGGHVASKLPLWPVEAPRTNHCNACRKDHCREGSAYRSREAGEQSVH